MDKLTQPLPLYINPLLNSASAMDFLRRQPQHTDRE